MLAHTLRQRILVSRAWQPFVRHGVRLTILASAVRFLWSMPVVRNGADAAKAIALGADAIALGHSVMMAMNCNKDIEEADYPNEIGAEPVIATIATPAAVRSASPPRTRHCASVWIPDEAAERVYNFLHTLTIEAQLFARACGKTHLHSLEPEDLAALTMEASAMAGVPLAGTNHTVGIEDYHKL